MLGNSFLTHDHELCERHQKKNLTGVDDDDAFSVIVQLQIPTLITCSMEQNVVSFTSRNLIVTAFSVILSFYIPALSYFDLIS